MRQADAHESPDFPDNTCRPDGTGGPDLTRWTGAKATAFIRLLARSGNVAACAQEVGMSRQAAYALRRRAPQFAEYWDMAMGEAARRKAPGRVSSQRAASRRERRKAAVHPLLAQGAAAPSCTTHERRVD